MLVEIKADEIWLTDDGTGECFQLDEVQEAELVVPLREAVKEVESFGTAVSEIFEAERILFDKGQFKKLAGLRWRDQFALWFKWVELLRWLRI